MRVLTTCTVGEYGILASWKKKSIFSGIQFRNSNEYEYTLRAAAVILLSFHW